MKFAIVLAGLVLAAPAWAARPFVTDDARLTTAGSCQLESWARLYEGSSEFWALPACNPTGNLEITLGGGRARHTAAETTDDYVLQFKTLFRPLTTNGWGWPWAGSSTRKLPRAPTSWAIPTPTCPFRCPSPRTASSCTPMRAGCATRPATRSATPGAWAASTTRIRG